jgi:predicted nucleotidyltransferase
MRTGSRNSTEALFSEGRSRVLGLLLPDPERRWHLREMARRVGLAPATVQREATALTEAGILLREREGHQVYYRANQRCPIFAELRGIAIKTFGLADVLREALAPFEPHLASACIFGSAAAGTLHADSDVDLLVVGEVGLLELTGALDEAEQRLGREINAVTMRPEEFRARVEAGEHFLTTVLARPMIFLIGDPDDLGKLGAGEEAAASPDLPGGDRRPAEGGRPRPEGRRVRVHLA